METGYDIIFFWVARMMMMGLHFMKKVPFRTVYLHAMVRDENGEKMSKMKGNVIDPLDVIRRVGRAAAAGAANKFPRAFRFGADALRFTLAALTRRGANIRLSLERVEGYRHFANKLWNATRFALMNLDGFDADRFADALADGPDRAELTCADRWILSRLQRAVARTVDSALEAFRFNDAAQALYQFVWGELCDWYIELAKPASTRRRRRRGAARRPARRW